MSLNSQKCYRVHYDFDYPLLMSFANPGTDEICRLLHSIRTIAIVGLPPKPDRPSFRIVPVRSRDGGTRAAGISVVMNRCIWRDYSQLCVS